jgi:hypothetical protein
MNNTMEKRVLLNRELTEMSTRVDTAPLISGPRRTAPVFPTPSTIFEAPVLDFGLPFAFPIGTARRLGGTAARCAAPLVEAFTMV